MRKPGSGFSHERPQRSSATVRDPQIEIHSGWYLDMPKLIFLGSILTGSGVILLLSLPYLGFGRWVVRFNRLVLVILIALCVAYGMHL